MQPSVLVTRATCPDIAGRLRRFLTVTGNPDDGVWSQPELIERLQGMRGAMTIGSERLDAALLDACPDLRAVCHVGDGALANALRDGRIAAAGLDVFEGEPTVHPALLEQANQVLTPHIASASTQARHAMAELAADNLIAALAYGPQAGKPPTPVNREVL